MEYTWYTIVEKSEEILQGDFIPECPIIIPPSSISDDDDEINADIQLIDSVIMSQSCDLSNQKIEIVLVCPILTLKTFLDSLPSDQSGTSKAKSKTIDNLKKGNLPSYHLLNKFGSYLEDYQVVDFRNVYGIHITSLKGICKTLDKRIRLLPPYREHLSQAFARYFMRVGLPQDLKVEGY